MECAIEGCVREAGYRGRTLRGWCQAHYLVWVKFKDPLGRPLREIDTGRCRIEGCARPSENGRANWCELHYMRKWRTGDPDVNHGAAGSDHFGWVGDEAVYRTAHARVVRAKGGAASHLCVSCGLPAHHWSFDWRRVPRDSWLYAENHSASPYSVDPDHYEPRCRSCALNYDRGYWGIKGRAPVPTPVGHPPANRPDTDPSYSTAHHRIALVRGQARTHRCIDCLSRAAHWSFAWRRVPLDRWLQKQGGRPYSSGIDDYDPRCHQCAASYDLGYTAWSHRHHSAKTGKEIRPMTPTDPNVRTPEDNDDVDVPDNEGNELSGG